VAQFLQPLNLLLVVLTSKNLLAQLADFIFDSTEHGGLHSDAMAWLLGYIACSTYGIHDLPDCLCWSLPHDLLKADMGYFWCWVSDPASRLSALTPASYQMWFTSQAVPAARRSQRKPAADAEALSRFGLDCSGDLKVLVRQHPPLFQRFVHLLFYGVSMEHIEATGEAICFVRIH
jgi:hypothetical protein